MFKKSYDCNLCHKKIEGGEYNALDSFLEHYKVKNCKKLGEATEVECPICMTRPGKELHVKHDNLLEHLRIKHNFGAAESEKEHPDKIARFYCEDKTYFNDIKLIIHAIEYKQE